MLSINLQTYNNIAEYKLSFDRLFNKELYDYFETLKKPLKNQLWHHLNRKDFNEKCSFILNLNKIEHLLQDFKIDKNLSYYNFKQIIIAQLLNAIPSINFDLDNIDYKDYDIVENNNTQLFLPDELIKIRKDQELNSLNHFENQTDYIKSKINSSDEKLTVKFNEDLEFDINQTTKLITDFDFEISPSSSLEKISTNPWLGETNELSPSQKKKLGNKAEVFVKKYLDSKPDLYDKVEHISKTNEGEHYDIKYYDMNDRQFKYVECKYYNGFSFFLSREEKCFADNNLGQYEIWLVNKDRKIYCIKNINELGELEPLNYKVNIKINEYGL